VTGNAYGLADPRFSLPQGALDTICAGIGSDLIIELLGACLHMYRIGSLAGPLVALIPLD
jgi:hypothetical protein